MNDDGETERGGPTGGAGEGEAPPDSPVSSAQPASQGLSAAWPQQWDESGWQQFGWGHEPPPQGLQAGWQQPGPPLPGWQQPGWQEPGWQQPGWAPPGRTPREGGSPRWDAAASQLRPQWLPQPRRPEERDWWAARTADRSSRRSFLPLGVAVLLIAALVMTAVAAAQLARRNGGEAGVSGPTLFSDDFDDPDSGWTVSPGLPGGGFGYVGGDYRADNVGGARWSLAPYDYPLRNPAITARGQIFDDWSEIEFGVVCARGSGDSRVGYEFLVDGDGRWRIRTRSGDPPAAGAVRELDSGLAWVDANSGPVTITAACVRDAGSVMTRLVLYVDGTKVADDSEFTIAALYDDDWRTGVVVDGEGGSGCARFSEFEVRVFGN